MTAALLLGVALAAAPLTDAQLAGAVREFQGHAHHPVPLPDVRQREKLLAGEVVRMRLPSDDGAPVGAMALVLSDLSKQELWLGTADDDDSDPPEELIIHHLPLVGDEMFRWYGHVDMPGPIADRHFLIRTTVNREVAAATGGRMWSRHWDMEADGLETMRAKVAAGGVPGLAPETFAASIWVPYNRGTWFFLDLPDGRTLLGYQATASVGGSFPDGLVNRYVYWGLERIMDEVVEKARQAKGHYKAGHAPIGGGDGQPIPPYP
jgi:hypothetical protein